MVLILFAHNFKEMSLLRIRNELFGIRRSEFPARLRLSNCFTDERPIKLASSICPILLSFKSIVCKIKNHKIFMMIITKICLLRYFKFYQLIFKPTSIRQVGCNISQNLRQLKAQFYSPPNHTKITLFL